MSLTRVDANGKTAFHIKNWKDRTEGGLHITSDGWDGYPNGEGPRGIWTPYGDIRNVTFDTVAMDRMYRGVHASLSPGQVCEKLQFKNFQISNMFAIKKPGGSAPYAQGVYISQPGDNGFQGDCRFDTGWFDHNGWLPEGEIPWTELAWNRCHHVYPAPGGKAFSYYNCCFFRAAMNAFRGLPEGNTIDTAVFVGNGSCGGGRDATWRNCVAFTDESGDLSHPWLHPYYVDVVSPPWEANPSNPPHMKDNYPRLNGTNNADIWHHPHNDPANNCYRFEWTRKADWPTHMQGFDFWAWMLEVMNTPLERRIELPDLHAKYVLDMAMGNVTPPVEPPVVPPVAPPDEGGPPSEGGEEHFIDLSGYVMKAEHDALRLRLDHHENNIAIDGQHFSLGDIANIVQHLDGHGHLHETAAKHIARAEVDKALDAAKKRNDDEGGTT